MVALHLRFENGVISYGSQTMSEDITTHDEFENGVISYGSQTRIML